MKERDDLQRLLRVQIDVLDPDLYVIAEEFSNWEDSSRRIDLLAIDRQANLVVIELKRTLDGGHMELQSLRYAAMVSAMTWEQMVEAHRNFLIDIGNQEHAEQRILSFLQWEEPQKDVFPADVRIVLASADFSKELTTAVLWLNERDLNIRCYRIVPYQNGPQLLVDVQQVIPLPEAEEYQIRLKEKAQQEREARLETSERHEIYRRFWTGVLEKAKPILDLHQAVTASRENWLVSSNYGIQFGYVMNASAGRVEVNLQRPTKAENKAIFDELAANRSKIEAAFGGPLSWQRLDDNHISKVACNVTGGSLKDEGSWDAMQTNLVATMKRFFNAIEPYVRKYREGAAVALPDAEEGE